VDGVSIKRRQTIRITMKGMTEDKLYSAIENAIIKWVIDGTKTAGSLTREIISIIKQQQDGMESNN
jgi:hypothetical protein